MDDTALADAGDDVAAYVEAVARSIRIEVAAFRSRSPSPLLSPDELSAWVRETRIAYADRVAVLLHQGETARMRMDVLRGEMGRRRWRRVLAHLLDQLA